MMRIRKLGLAGAVMMGVMSGALAFASAPASALLQHVYSGHAIGPGGLGSGTFMGVQGVTVDQSSGDVYVDDTAEGGSLYKFDSSGKPVAFTGLAGKNVIREVGLGPYDENEIAVDSSSGPDKGDVYIADGGAVNIYNGTTGAKLGQITAGETCGVAIDTSGEVYVGIYGSLVNKYKPVTNPVTNANYTEALNGLPGICEVAADSEGDVYSESWPGGPIYKWDASQFSTKEVAATGTLVDNVGNSLAVDPAPTKDDLYVNEGGDIAHYDSEGHLLERFGAEGPGTIGGGYGVGVDHTSGTIYAAAAGLVQIFNVGGIVPDVHTAPVTDVTRTTATFHGTLDPDEVEVSGCQFEYRTAAESTYGHTAPCSSIPPKGNTPVAVSAEVTTLSGNTTYFYRLDGSNANGSNHGTDVETFETPVAVQGVTTNAVTGAGSTDATLNGSVEPNGLDTHCWFEYEPAGESGTSTAKEDYGSEAKAKAISVPLSGLNPNEAYNARLACENADGTTYGAYLPLVTSPAAPIIYGESVSHISRARALLSAVVNPGNEATTYFFEYGTTEEYGYETAVTPLSTSAGGHVTAEGLAGELTTNTLYHYRLVVKNGSGTSFGADETFTSGHLTPPTVTTGEVTGISPTGATISGTISTAGLVTEYGFEIGTVEGEYGPPTGLGSIGAGFNEATATLGLRNLQPNTTYYYKVIGISVDGASEGEVKSFKTTSFPTPNITVDQLRVLTQPFVEWPTGSQEDTSELPPAKKVVKKHKAKKKKHHTKKKKGKGKKGKHKG